MSYVLEGEKLHKAKHSSIILPIQNECNYFPKLHENEVTLISVAIAVEKQ